MGSASTLRHSQLLSCLLDLLDRRSWQLTLPPQAHLLHTALRNVPPNPSGDIPIGHTDDVAHHANAHRRLVPPRPSHPITTAVFHELHPEAAGPMAGAPTLPRALAPSHGVEALVQREGMVAGRLDW